LKSSYLLSLSKNSLLSLWNLKVHYCVHKSPPPDSILRQLNPVCPIDPYLTKVHLNVILPSSRRSSQCSLPFGPPNQNSVNTSSLPHACHMSCPLHAPGFNQCFLRNAQCVFLPQSERSCFTPIQHNWQNYSFVHFNL